jgi:hypothetical protein
MLVKRRIDTTPRMADLPSSFPARLQPVQRITVRQHHRLLESFDRTGSSTHSGNRLTLGYIIDHCEQTNIPYRLLAKPGVGYYIERWDDERA